MEFSNNKKPITQPIEETSIRDKNDKNISTLRVHQRRIHINKTTHLCSICKNEFTAKGSLVKHIQMIHEKIRVKCTKCDATFSQNRHLNDHVKTYHSSLVQEYDCLVCETSFASKNNMKQHYEEMHQPKSTTCKTCGIIFGSNQKLKSHVNIVHEKIKPYKCNLCPGMYNQISEREAHIRRIHGEQNVIYKCKECDHSYKSRKPLTKHIREVHKVTKMFPCESCDKIFRFQSHFTIHVSLVHEGLKQFKCKQCDKSFKQKGKLLNHEKAVHNKQLLKCNE